MNETYLMPAAVLLPLVGGGLLYALKKLRPGAVPVCTLGVTCLTSILVWLLILRGGENALPVLRFAPDLQVVYRLDGLGRFFVGILATLWPLTVLYAMSYMEGEPRQGSFYCFFTLSYAVSLGVAMAGNLFTLYFNYEMLTLATMPLVLHSMTRQAVKATRTYLLFSLGGAAFAFASMIFLIANGAGGSFTFGGLLTAAPYGKPWITRIFFVLGFFGFGVKAAVFPLHVWLPKASVAPTPVTALLHAVAVVKAGAFAVMRLTWYCYGPDLLRGTWAQWLPLSIAAFTVVYGSVMAIRQPHLKRRLAYSTVSNLSYILVGVLLMTPAGLAAGLTHMAAHACIKILAFFCAGAILRRAGAQYNAELSGLGRKMPVTLGTFTVSALALTGIPLFNGFVSKWQLLTAAADAANPMAYVSAGALLLSALLTAIYMLTPAARAWFPGKDRSPEAPGPVREADWRMTAPHLILALGCIVFGCWSQPILEAAARIAGL
ncbi:MAG: proton-conducting membrane transporter [Oscillospiraceae bacterium]|nr:proton-conducting membrane transporter [Oscillospiraceae bacterium]